MDAEQVVTLNDVRDFLSDLTTRAQSFQGSLEEYLRGALRALHAHEHDTPSTSLIVGILAEGLTIEPAPFDEAWLIYKEPGDIISTPGWSSPEPFQDALRLLRFQIADLRRMAVTDALDNPYRSMGINSPTGHTWYNFDPQAFLDCASYGIKSSTEPADFTWEDLAIILWLGQIME